MRLLFTTFEGGGHVPPAILVARLLQARGHEVLLVSDEANRAAAEGAGLTFTAWRSAPNRAEAAQADDPLDDWRRLWPPAVVKAVCDAVITGPAAEYAADTATLIDEFHPDRIVTNELLFGVMAAAEARGVPLALMTANVWCFPTRDDTPPFGPGWPRARSCWRTEQQATVRRMIAGWYDAGLGALNAARLGLGLEPLAHALDQLRVADRVVLGTSAAFDLGDDPPPAPFVYAGPLFDSVPLPRSALLADDRPNVLVSFSTTFQDQAGLMARCLQALEPLPVRVIVTTGPAVDPASLPTTANSTAVRFEPHDALVPYCALVVCHGGHGTLLRPVMAGVPVVSLPMGRDHPENGRRLVEHGAGVMLNRRASAGRIRAAVQRVLDDGAFTDAARALGQRIVATAPGERAEALNHLEGGQTP